MDPQESRRTKAAEKLVKHRGGVYYLYAKVAGKPIRVGLDTGGPSNLQTQTGQEDAKPST